MNVAPERPFFDRSILLGVLLPMVIVGVTFLVIAVGQAIELTWRLVPAVAFAELALPLAVSVGWGWSRTMGLRFGVVETLTLLLLGSLTVAMILPTTATRSLDELQSSPLNVVNVTRSIFVAVAGVISAIVVIKHPRLLSTTLSGGFLPLSSFALLALVSSTYAPLTIGSLSWSIPYAIDIITFSVITSLAKENPQDQIGDRVFATVTLYLSLLTAGVWLSAVVDPATSLVRHGILPTPGNGVPQVHHTVLGFVGGYLTIVAVARLLSASSSARRISVTFWLGLLALGLITVVFAQARTSLLATAAAIGMLMLISKRGRFLIPISTTLAAAVGLLFGTALFAYLRRGQDTELLLSLTGRTSLWRAALSLASDSLLLGHGYYTGVRVELGQITQNWGFYENVSTTDNVALRALVELGIPGLVAILSAFVVFSWNALRALRFGIDQSEPFAVAILVGAQAATGSAIEVHHIVLIVFLLQVMRTEVLWHKKENPRRIGQTELRAPHRRLSPATSRRL